MNSNHTLIYSALLKAQSPSNYITVQCVGDTLKVCYTKTI